MPLVSVRPEASDGRSRSFILSIDAKWVQSLLEGRLTCIIRKRLPYASEVKSVYFHAKSPASSIFGRAKVVRIEKVSVADAIARKTDLHMHETEIKSYTSGLSKIGLMDFTQFESTNEPVGMQVLRDRLDYYPPQSFAFISRAALPIINELCGF